MKNFKFSKGFSKNFWILFVMAIILGSALWSVGGSRILDISPYYLKYILGNTAKVSINNHVVDVEIAETAAARVKGLSSRNYLENNHGMLFIFENEDYHNFTLRDTKISLDIIWILDDKIVDIKPRVLPGTEVLTPLNKANYVLEVKPGTAASGGWQVDDEVIITFDR